MQQEDFLTVAEAAAVLRVSSITVQTLCRQGKLEACRLGRAWRIPRASFETFRQGLKTTKPMVQAGELVVEAELAQLVEAWMRDMEHGPQPRSRDTILTYRQHLRKYVRVLLGSDPDGRVTFRDLFKPTSMQVVLARIPVTQYSTRFNAYTAVRSFGAFLVRLGLLEEGDRAALRPYRPKRLTPAKRTVFNSMEDVNRFFDALWMSEAHSTYEKTLNAAMVGMMVFAGLRVSEVANLSLANVDLDAGIVFVENGKGGKNRIVGINPRLQGMITAYLRVRPASDEGALFLSAKGRPLVRQYLINRICRIARLSGQRISAHGLRRTFATLNANAGKSLNLIQLALGHSTLTTTQTYLMADQNAAARAMQGW